MPTFHRILVIVLTVLVGASARAYAQAEPAPVLPGRPDAAAPAPADAELLGESYKSIAAGIEFRGPADCKAIPRTGADLVTYVNEAQRWSLKVNRLTFDNPIEMTYHPQDPDNKQSRDVNGLFQETIDTLKTDAPGITLYTSDREIQQKGPLDVGWIKGKYVVGKDTNLVLIALVRERPADVRRDASYVYYSFNFNATFPDVPNEADLRKDPRAMRAEQMFNAVIGTVQVLDQTVIREDQNRRLFRTRGLMVNLTEPRLTAALAPETFLRVIKDGKDIGYTYTVEETGRDLPRRGGAGGQREALQAANAPEGVLVGVRSRTFPEPGTQIDAESWFWSSFDRRHEKFTTSSNIRKAPETTSEIFREIGWCDTLTKLVKDDSLLPGQERIGRDRAGVDKSQPAVRQTEVTSLHVNYSGKAHAGEPLQRDLPPFYLPQAVGHLLPRVLAKMSPGKTYLFATYHSAAREVMMRYIDVDDIEKDYTLDGQRIRAIAVSDRIGLEGVVTTHYVTANGKYLGSVNASQKITILPTDAATISRLWKNADLTRPAEVEEKR